MRKKYIYIHVFHYETLSVLQERFLQPCFCKSRQIYISIYTLFKNPFIKKEKITIIINTLLFLLFTDILGPIFSNCPQNIIATADRGNTSASVTWIPPAATDNSGVVPDIMHFGKGPGERFPAGEHSIRYIASDKRGNVGECKFKIIVRGIVLGKAIFARINVVIIEFAINQDFAVYRSGWKIL